MEGRTKEQLYEKAEHKVDRACSVVPGSIGSEQKIIE